MTAGHYYRGTMSDQILICDGMSLFIRHFLANPTVSTKGEFAGGVIGFLGSLATVINLTMPKQVIVVWEGGGSVKKRALFSEYKARKKPQKMNRFHADDIPTTVDNRNWQVATIVSLLKTVPVLQLYVENCEADDVIGYLCKYKYPQDPKVIISSDRDFYQLLNDRTKIYTPNTKKYVTSSDVVEKFGISPENFCLAKAICGDVSDNIPGVGGVGFKGLAKRFPELAADDTLSIEEIVKRAAERNEEKQLQIYSQIIDNEEIIRRNWKLVLLDTGNLSASQVKKIEDGIDQFAPRRDKMGLLRALVREGLGIFDADRFFVSFNGVMRD
jgi:DNA polymerase I